MTGGFAPNAVEDRHVERTSCAARGSPTPWFPFATHFRIYITIRRTHARAVPLCSKHLRSYREYRHVTRRLHAPGSLQIASSPPKRAFYPRSTPPRWRERVEAKEQRSRRRQESARCISAAAENAASGHHQDHAPGKSRAQASATHPESERNILDIVRRHRALCQSIDDRSID